MRILETLHRGISRRIAGVEVYADALAREFAARHEVGVFYPDITATGPRGELRTTRELGLTRFEMASPEPATSFVGTYRDPVAERVFDEVLRRFRPDIVHAHHLMGLSTGLPSVARKRGIPVVLTLHDYWLQCAAGGQRFQRELGRCDVIDLERCADCTAHLSGAALWARRASERIGLSLSAPTFSTPVSNPSDDATGWNIRDQGRQVLALGSRATRVSTSRQARKIRARWDAMHDMIRSVDLWIAPSRHLEREMLLFGLPPESSMHLDNGIPHHHFGPKRPLPETARHFASLGSIVPHKGVHVLIDAFASLPGDARLTIWGDLEADPTYVRHLRSRVRHPGINFAGCLEPEHVPGRLREADCLVVPSIWAENSPLVIQEAFAAGIPVLASGLGGIPEQLRAGGGLLVQANEPLELGRALRRLYTERGLARALVEKAPPAKRMGEHAKELTTRYEALVDKARKRGRVKRAEFAGEVL